MESSTSMFEILGLEATAKRHLAKGETLFLSGDQVINFFALESGKVRMVRHLADGRGVTFYVATPGQMFAEASLFSQTYHCDVVADEPTTVAAYPKSSLIDALRNNEDVSFKFMAHLAQQVQSLRAQIEIMNIKSAPERVLAYIYNKMPSGEFEVIIDRTWKTAATEIGLTYEAVYRALAKLEGDGIIFRNGAEITLRVGPDI